MNMFIDREIALQRMKSILSEKDGSWSILSGKKIGKTKFAKQIVKEENNGAIIEPRNNPQRLYAENFLLTVFSEETISNVIYRFGRRDKFTEQLFKDMSHDGITNVTKVEIFFILRRLIQNDVHSKRYIFANTIAKEYIPSHRYIFLDDFNLCDYDNYNWLVEFWNSIEESSPKMIAICNFNLKWESDKVNEHLTYFCAPIDIHKFDNEEAFYKLIGSTVSFDNETVLIELARGIYDLFDGDAESVIELIALSQSASSLTSDEKKKSKICKIANEIIKKEFPTLNSMSMMMLQFLAFSPVSLSKHNISQLIEVEESIITEFLNQLLDNGFIKCSIDERTANNVYDISSEFLSDTFKQNCSKERRDLFFRKIFTFINCGYICASTNQFLEVALEVSIEKAKCLILKMLHNVNADEINEQLICYVNKYINAGGELDDEICTLDMARLLYKYGYYDSAYHVMTGIKDNFDSYETYMLMGDIQHILLKPKASETYRVASELPDISISQKISAINNLIMSLNQESEENDVTQIYKEALNDYKDEECLGLVELYRNTNNSFEYDEAMEFTIKGYCLASKLGTEFEKYKCLHNICMMRLQYGLYDEVFQDERIKEKAIFDTSLHYFNAHSEYRHECAYPLLDLGTVEMFRFASDNDINHVKKARKYYSDAQLYSRSFYARHIAEMGLLVTNTYLYKDSDPDYVTRIILTAQEHYEKECNDIADSRVHRKILLSIILSKIISGQVDEIRNLFITVSNYMEGYEIMRFNGLCEKVNCEDLKKTMVSLNGRNKIYYGSCKFVPWLISMCH